MTQKKHINNFLAPTQSRDNPANLFMFMFFSFPDRCGSGPKCRLDGPPPSIPLRPRTPPLHLPGPPPPGALQKEPGRLGETEGGWGGRSCGLREGSCSYNGRLGGDLPKMAVGTGHTSGASRFFHSSAIGPQGVHARHVPSKERRLPYGGP